VTEAVQTDILATAWLLVLTVAKRCVLYDTIRCV